MATWHEGRFVLLNACDDEGCLVMMGWWDGRGIRHLYMSRLVLCEYSVRSNCWVLCFGGPTYVLRYSSVADSCNSWHGTVSMCRESLWQEQTGSSMLHTFITPKITSLSQGCFSTYWYEACTFCAGVFVHMLYVLLISVGVWLFVNNLDWFAYADGFFYDFFLKWCNPQTSLHCW